MIKSLKEFWEWPYPYNKTLIVLNTLSIVISVVSMVMVSASR